MGEDSEGRREGGRLGWRGEGRWLGGREEEIKGEKKREEREFIN